MKYRIPLGSLVVHRYSRVSGVIYKRIGLHYAICWALPPEYESNSGPLGTWNTRSAILEKYEIHAPD